MTSTTHTTTATHHGAAESGARAAAHRMTASVRTAAAGHARWELGRARARRDVATLRRLTGTAGVLAVVRSAAARALAAATSIIAGTIATPPAATVETVAAWTLPPWAHTPPPPADRLDPATTPGTPCAPPPRPGARLSTTV